ncbi:MAG: carboxymuconolactone decarboxylase family protein [Actinobacteria bacterium]|nr:carboxymuconolactone decarboxylase family protein [Actinomycetota bacterium]
MTEAPRVAPLTKDEFGDDETRALRAFVGDAGVERFLGEGDTPPLPAVLGTLIRHPALAAKWLPYNDVLLRTGTLDARLREIVICRVGWRTAAEYEWLQHVRLAHGLGVTDAEIAAVADRGTVEWAPLEADLLAATDALLDGYEIPTALWDRLAEHLDQRQMIELVFVVGTYTCLAMAFKSFGVQLDADLVDYPAPRMTDRTD